MVSGRKHASLLPDQSEIVSDREVLWCDIKKCPIFQFFLDCAPVNKSDAKAGSHKRLQRVDISDLGDARKI